MELETKRNGGTRPWGPNLERGESPRASTGKQPEYKGRRQKLRAFLLISNRYAVWEKDEQLKRKKKEKQAEKKAMFGPAEDGLTGKKSWYRSDNDDKAADMN